jgi:subtilase-type serine protease
VKLVGYGFAGTGTQPGGIDQNGNLLPGTVVDSRRRIGETNIGAVEKEPSFDPSALAVIAAQFRNPQPPPNPDDFGLAAKGIPVPGLQAQSAPGDSGGPLFIVTPNGLVQIGTVIGGQSPSGYGSIAWWTQVQLYDSFINDNNPLRSTTSQAGTFSWSQSAAWLDTLGRSEVPNNTDGNFNGFGTLGRYYNVTIAAPTLMSLDMNPTIDTLSIAGAQSQLVIGAPHTLGVVVSTTLSAGTLAMSGGTLISPEFLMSGGLLTARTARLQGSEDTAAGLSLADLAGVDRRFRRRTVI